MFLFHHNSIEIIKNAFIVFFPLKHSKETWSKWNLQVLICGLKERFEYFDQFLNVIKFIGGPISSVSHLLSQRTSKAP